MDAKIKEKMNNRIRKVIKERSGPSFEARVAVSAAKFQKETKVIEDSQHKVIQAALARAKAHPCESPFRSKDLTPPSIEELGKAHAHTRRTNEARYAQDAAERKNRMDTREPLFRLSEVNAAFEMQRQRQLDNKKRMQDEEAERWQHLQELQQRVIDRPLLLENPSAVVTNQKSDAEEPQEEGAAKDPNWKAKFQKKMTKRIVETIKDRSGPSFEERVAVRSAKFRKETRVIEQSQAKTIEHAISKAKARPSESPFRSKDLTPPSIEDWGKEHAQTRSDNEARYAQVYAERKNRMDAREPLFRVSEVQAAFQMQEDRKAENMSKLRQDEKERWAFLKSMQERVVDRPLLVESYERPIHSKSETELRLIPNHTKPPQSQINIQKCVSLKSFQDSAWGKEVATLRQRMNDRPKLHEIAYPPKVIPEKPAPQKQYTPLDQRLHDVMSQPWYKKSQWASEVEAIQGRQDNRVKLHEQAYPPKKYE